MPRRNDFRPDSLAKDRDTALQLISVSEADKQRLIIYQDLLLRWQSILNLVSATTLPHLWTRHFADSGQLRDLAPGALRWADMGSGGGFPGMVLAILLAEVPGAQMHLIERDKRKAAFLQTVSRETGAPAIVHAASAEKVMPLLKDIEVVTSRAMATLGRLIDWSRPLLQGGASGLFLKGGSVQQEIDALTDPRLDLSTLPSRTDSSGRIVSVRYRNA